MDLPKGWKIDNIKSTHNSIVKKQYIKDEQGEIRGANCTQCRHFYKIEYFYTYNTSLCKKCKREQVKNYRKKNPEKVKNAKKKYKKDNSQKIKEARKANKHAPIIYKITFYDESVYIGQTKNLKDRKERHLNLAKRGKIKSHRMPQLFNDNSTEFMVCLERSEILEVFDKNTSDFYVTTQEYKYQIESMEKGEKLLGRQYYDKYFQIAIYSIVNYERAKVLLEKNKLDNEINYK